MTLGSRHGRGVQDSEWRAEPEAEGYRLAADQRAPCLSSYNKETFFKQSGAFREKFLMGWYGA